MGFVGESAPLSRVETHLGLGVLGNAGAPEDAKPSEVRMDSDRRDAAAIYLPQCEALLEQTLAATLAASPPVDPAAARKLPRRQHLLLKGREGEWATYDEGRVCVQCLLAVVSLGTGAPDPRRSAREVVAAFSEVMVGDSPIPKETAAEASRGVAAASLKRSSRKRPQDDLPEAR